MPLLQSAMKFRDLESINAMYITLVLFGYSAKDPNNKKEMFDKYYIVIMHW